MEQGQADTQPKDDQEQENHKEYKTTFHDIKDIKLPPNLTVHSTFRKKR